MPKFPLTLTQNDIYFDQLHHPDNPLYNVGGYIRLKQIQPEKLVNVHRQLVLSDEIFGLRIVSSADGLAQHISQDRTTALQVLDFSAEA